MNVPKPSILGSLETLHGPSTWGRRKIAHEVLGMESQKGIGDIWTARGNESCYLPNLLGIHITRNQQSTGHQQGRLGTLGDEVGRIMEIGKGSLVIHTAKGLM